MYGMVLPRFVAAALKNAPLQVYGDGKQTRCFCHVGDVIDACAALMDKPQSVGQVYNLGNDEEISIAERASAYEEWSRTRLGEFGDRVQRRLMLGAMVSGVDYVQAVRMRREVRAAEPVRQ